MVSILDLNGVITGELCQICCIRTIPSPPLELLRKGNTHSLNTTTGSAVEGEGVVRSHIGKMSGVGSEGNSQGWDYTVKGGEKVISGEQQSVPQLKIHTGNKLSKVKTGSCQSLNSRLLA